MSDELKSRPSPNHYKEKTSGKREKYLSWDGYFMSMAFLNSLRSKDPDTRHGACIVDDNNVIVANGYNGFPNKCSDDIFSWNREGEENKFLYVIHSEVNAILNANSKVNGCKMYLFSEKGYYPCNECAKIIIQSGISEILMATSITSNTKIYDFNVTMKMFAASGVKASLLNFDNVCKDFTLVSNEFKSFIDQKNIEILEGKIKVNKES